MKVVTVAQMRALERAAVEAGVTEDALMESAGLAVARRIGTLLQNVRGKRVLVLVGPGNNGGDGMVAARYLSDWGALVTLYMTSTARRADKFDECRQRRVRVVEGKDDVEQWALGGYMPVTDMVVDAVFGIGMDLALEGAPRAALAAVKRAKLAHAQFQLVAVDVPSGLNADTGAVDDATPPADVTLTLGAPKIGSLRFPGAALVGQMECVPIGLPAAADEGLPLDLSDDKAVAALLPARPLDGHKGTFGHVLVVAGSRRFVGASVLASLAAYRAGAGLVTLAAPDAVYRLAATQMLEAVHVPLAQTDDGFVSAQAAGAVRLALGSASAAVIGPGLGDAEPVQRFVHDVLLVEPVPKTPVVIDADALNVLALSYGWADRLTTPAVLTPHPGEMSRLLRMPVSDVQQDRVGTAQESARRWRQIVVLKGAHTVVAAPDGRATISPFANPALASGGTGDVLAGVIGALLAQGLPPYEAAVAGVHVHGAAGGRVHADTGDAGLIASDLLEQLPRVARDLRAMGTWVRDRR